MTRTHVWLLIAGAVLGVTGLCLTQALARRDFVIPPAAAKAAVPGARYQVVTVNETEIILLDVITGDLYSAKARDVKPYSARPRVDGSRGFSTELKDEMKKDYVKDLKFTDKGGIKEKFDYKDKEK